MDLFYSNCILSVYIAKIYYLTLTEFKRHPLSLSHGAYRTIKAGFNDFPGSFYVHFPWPFMFVFHVFPGPFNWLHIEQVRFSHTSTKSTTTVNVFQLTMINRMQCFW